MKPVSRRGAIASLAAAVAAIPAVGLFKAVKTIARDASQRVSKEEAS